MSRAGRPKIEVVRVSSTERAKILPLLEGGVQLQARFKHHLSNNYASCSSLDDAAGPCRDPPPRLFSHERCRSSRRQLATKSCDNIFSGQLGGGPEQDGPFTWQDATRSEEQLCPDSHDARCSTLPAGEATKSEGHIHQITRTQASAAVAPLGTRFRLISLLKKLSPRPKRFTNKVLRAQNVFPWVVVEFSSKDLGASKSERAAAGHSVGRCNSEDSAASDRSFAAAVKINKLRKQQALAAKLQPKETKKPEEARAAAPSQIVVTSPGVSPTLVLVSDEQTPSLPGGSFARGGGAAKVGSPLRPDSLKLPPGRPAPPSLSLTPDARVHCRMASFESIGSCSLDAEVTASEASECNEDSASERTLRSVSLLTKTPEADVPYKPVAGGASTPEYVKRTAKLFESNSVALDKADEKSGTQNGNSSEPPDVNCDRVLANGTGVPGKKPSYLSLACSISGYSGITTYDSKLREGFRSRDQSPGRLGLIRSREVSPLRQGGDRSEGSAPARSECGNFLVPPTKGIARFVVGTPSSVSEGFLELEKPCLPSDKLRQNKSDRFVNGFDKFDSKSGLCSAVEEQDMGDESTVVVSSDGRLKNGSSEISPSKLIDDGRRRRTAHKDTVPRESLSDTVAAVRESSRHFMSSMLSSSSFSALNSEPAFDRTKAEELRSPGQAGQDKPSDATETGSKDSLGTPVVSPLKRSPGAVRVVEFTSQAKSYVKTVSPGGCGHVQASSSLLANHSAELAAAHEAAMDSLASSMNACKSFIQQRVERLYGPGALAQGFFMRTKSLHREADGQVGEDVPDAEVPASPGGGSVGSPALPVLRHLRPEFRAQLCVAVPGARRPRDGSCPEGKVTIIPVHVDKSGDVPTLQQQVSVESVVDLQPAALEVVLPVDQSQLESHPTVSLKDGHYFLNLLKKELDRLDGLACRVEADLERGEGLPEEALGKLRTAAGQARLLMRQKLQQFEGLCQKNLAQSSDEPFPTTSEDLAGFWDMVKLQVDHVDRLFAEIDELRANNWVEDKPRAEVLPEAASPAGGAKRQSAPSKKALPKSAPPRQENTKHAEAARKTREDARRKMMEQRRKAMREKAAASAAAPADVEIFVPLENGKHV